MPGQIESLETEQAKLIESMGTPEFYKQPPTDIASARARQEELERKLDAAYARWAELED